MISILRLNMRRTVGLLLNVLHFLAVCLRAGMKKKP